MTFYLPRVLYRSNSKVHKCVNEKVQHPRVRIERVRLLRAPGGGSAAIMTRSAGCPESHRALSSIARIGLQKTTNKTVQHTGMNCGGNKADGG